MQLEGIYVDINVREQHDWRCVYAGGDICYGKEFDTCRILEPSFGGNDQLSGYAERKLLHRTTYGKK